MANNGPRSAVFTTLLVNSRGEVADWEHHAQRLSAHAQRLRITLPSHQPTIGREDVSSLRLARILCRSGEKEWDVDVREIPVRNEELEAISYPAPRWNERTNGTKHGAWDAYHDAQEAAEAKGCDVALLIHEYNVVDADRGTPLVLDEDGTVWVSSSGSGGVESITLGILRQGLPALGLPVIEGQLNERTVARCAEMVVVGTGLGACRIASIDGEPLGRSTALSAACQRLLHEHFTDEATWSKLGSEVV